MESKTIEHYITTYLPADDEYTSALLKLYLDGVKDCRVYDLLGVSIAKCLPAYVTPVTRAVYAREFSDYLRLNQEI